MSVALSEILRGMYEQESLTISDEELKEAESKLVRFMDLLIEIDRSNESDE